MEEEKKCNRCGKIYPLSCFHIDRSKKDGHKTICKKCLSKKQKNVNLKIDKNIRQSLIYCLKHDGSFRWGRILGFNKDDIKKHLEKEFTDGMSFDNYGEWGVTFHIPKRCYSFSSINSNEFRKCWSLKNLKPMWMKDIKKQKIEISEEEINKYSLWDILPEGINLNKIIRK